MLTPLDLRDRNGALIGRIWREDAAGVVTYFAVHRCGRRSPNYDSASWVLARQWLEQQEAKHVRV